jgi:predicted ArsR family transcriptional regulator
MKKLPIRSIRHQTSEPTREAVLRVLKLRGEMTAAELCKVLKITHTAVRRHLSLLQSKGLVVSRSYQHGAGRPAYKYRPAATSSAHFPLGYEDLASNLLDTIFEKHGHTGVMDFLRLNNERLVSALAPRFSEKSLRQRVEEMAHYFAEHGYMTDWTELPDGNFFLYHQNCAIYKLAERFRQLCILEPRLMESLLGVKVSRQQYILKNQPICGYLVDAKRPVAGV